jgi:hypothetical protein
MDDISSQIKKQRKGVTFQQVNEESSDDCTLDQIQRLTNKKREYLDEAIEDRNGVYDYAEDPREYKKARK